MSDIPTHPTWDQIEPAVKSELERYQGHFASWPGEHEIELSKAISLKRIADALWGDNQNTGIMRSLAFMEDNTRA